MKKYIAILLLTFSGSAFAEAYLCIPEAAAGIRYNPKNDSYYKAVLFDPDQYKFIQSNSSGKWTVKTFELDATAYEYCETKFYCLRSKDNIGDYFIRFNANQFEALLSSITNLETGAANKILYMGKCSKI